jgi:hypothetical protein
MAKKSSQPESSGSTMVQLTLRLTQNQVTFVIEGGSGNPNENIRAIIEDARNFYGLPSPIVETLIAKYTGGRRLDLSKYEDRRELIVRALTEHYTNLITKNRSDD